MAHAGFPAGGFKPETIQCVIASIQHIWSDRSAEKLEALFGYLKSKGVKSETDVDTIDEAELGTVIGPQPASSILEHFRELKRKEKEEERGRQGANGAIFQGPQRHSDGGAESGPSQELVRQCPKDMMAMFMMFKEMQMEESNNNRKMIQEMQKGMQETIERVTGTIMGTMKVMNDKLTEQMGLQQQLLDKLGGEIVAMEQRHQATTRQSQQWMENTQAMNNKVLMELTRKVNDALEAKEDTKSKLAASSAAPKPPQPNQRSGSCTVL